MIVIVMGVSGAGKTVVGERVAARLGCAFIDADDFHPPANVEKMRAGTPLTDDDRWPWLASINQRLRDAQTRGASVVLACSALKQIYRDRLSEGIADVRVVHLSGSFQLIAQRLQARQHRYMPSTLLKSQFATLEAPAQAITIDIDAPLDALVNEVCAALPPRKEQSMQNAKLKVTGMTCQGCVGSVTKILSRTEGVASAQVSLDAAQAEVAFDPAKVSPQQLCASLNASGYPSTVV